MQVVHAHLGRDALVLHWPRLKQGELTLRGQVQDVQSAAVPLREFHRQARRLVARLLGTDLGVHLERDRVAVARPGSGFVGQDRRRVLAMRRDDERRRREDALERCLVVDQHVAGRCAHEHFHAAGP